MSFVMGFSCMGSPEEVRWLDYMKIVGPHQLNYVLSPLHRVPFHCILFHYLTFPFLVSFL